MQSPTVLSVARRHPEVARAHMLCDEAKDLIEMARATRVVIHAQRRHPLRRIMSLARGGSDRRLEVETEERRCPYCGEKTVSPVGSVVAANNKIRIAYRCDGCDKRFVLLRAPLDF